MKMEMLEPAFLARYLESDTSIFPANLSLLTSNVNIVFHRNIDEL